MAPLSQITMINLTRSELDSKTMGSPWSV
ncbi:hypothetical protein EYZ11_005474 [Aspergillus tanneri]|uniref:Uncharacterized protein n=1 Tax=Aspergillus tanneri TaxID=1220188 RepID=A0A4S3JHU3_9EURO|nr:hypothetical protein EYZ11_005474 [Aspergillus tanneri]